MYQDTDPADGPATTSAVTNKVSCTSTKLARSDAPNLHTIPAISCPDLMTSMKCRSQTSRRVRILVLATKTLLNELAAILAQMCTELATCAGKLMQCVEIEMSG
jgi:hypothetical protein